MYAEGGIVDLERLALTSGRPARSMSRSRSTQSSSADRTTSRREAGVDARLDVSRTSTGYALRLRFATELTGPCVRCLEPATTEIGIDAREVDQPTSRDEELRSPYVTDGELDVGRWANDAVVLALPEQPLCRPDCAGLCAVCGEPLNDADPEAHRHETGGDPRMAKLRDLKLE